MRRTSAQVVGSGRVGPEPDGGRVVIGNVADGQGHDAGGRGGGGEAAPLNGAEMFADAVHLVDWSAGGEQGAVDRPQIVKREAIGRALDQRGGAAGHEDDDEVVGGEVLDGLEAGGWPRARYWHPGPGERPR